MRAHRLLFRLTATTALTSLLLGSVAPAYAQPAPPPGAEAQAQGGSALPSLPVANAPLPANDPQPEPSDQVANDPPARVGSVSSLSGTVSFHTADADHWVLATQNFPVTSGNSFWTQPNATVDLDVGGSRITLDQTTEFTVDTLNDQSLNATVSLGRVFVMVGDVTPGQTATFRTPRGTVSLTRAGRYEITVGDTQTPTLVTVDDGAADFNGPGVQLAIGPKQTGQISGTDPFEGIVVAEVPDAFLERQLGRLRPQHITAPANLPPVVQQMTGYQDLITVGQWQQTPDYGEVWYPPVAADWVPYRHGRWSYVAPWGWTWVDEAPWGFAPFHYGRWAQIGPRWGWIPVAPGVAYEERPVYAPALVTFLGAAAGVAVGVGIGAAVGWIPLGPHEVYRPPYRASNNYVRQVNITNVTNVANINTVNNRYVNNNFRTVVPAAAMQRSLPVAQQFRAVPQLQNAALQPQARPPVQPTLATRGFAPAVATTTNGRPAGGVPGQPATPGVQPRPGSPVSGPLPNGARPQAAVPVGVPSAAQGAAVAARPLAPGARPPIPQASVGAVQTPARPTTPGIAPSPGAPQPGVPQPGVPQVARPAPPAGAAQIARPATPQPAPQPAPQIARPATPQPAPQSAPQVARPVPQPAPQVARPAPQPQIARPVPQPAPQIARPAPPQPAPQIARPAPPQIVRPQPQVQPAPRPAPAPVAAPRPAPAPAPQPRPAPAPEHKACPPGKPTC